MESNGTGNIIIQDEETKKPSNLKRVLAQVLACSANNFILFDNGLVLSFPTIVIGTLLNNENDPLSLTEYEASWYASIALLFQPIGSLFSGLVMEPLGRKRSMLLLNIPFFTAWTMMFYANSISMFYAAGAIMGFSVGCTEAPILTYVGEISEPSFRGILTSYAQFCGSAAYVLVYFVGAITTWRYTASICALIPLLTLAAVSLVPETPFWLVSRGRIKEAEDSLRWLRGWAKPEDVKEELQQIIKYYESMNGPTQIRAATESTEILVGEKSGLKNKITYFLRPQMRKPLLLIIIYFFFFYASGLQTIRPFFNHVFTGLGMEMEPDKAAVIVAIIGLLGIAACMCTVSFVGKRTLSMLSLIGSAVSTFFLAAVAAGSLSSGWAFPMMLVFSFFTSIGITPIPWMLQSELYPYNGKCLAAGIAAAVSYLIGFAATKSYFGLEEILHLYGVFILFGCMSLVGAVYLWARLPETEGRTFEEIEQTFQKKIDERKIPK